jgi:hypothetical protein
MDCGDENALGSPLFSPPAGIWPMSTISKGVSPANGITATFSVNGMARQLAGKLVRGSVKAGEGCGGSKCMGFTVVPVWSMLQLCPLCRPIAACAMVIRLSTSRSSNVTGNSLT